jgi:hypothetical protein
MAPYVPKYVSPKQAAQQRAELRTRLLWIAAAIPLLFVLLAFGYSDQAPAFLRDGVRALDASLGYPILSLLAWIVR